VDVCFVGCLPDNLFQCGDCFLLNVLVEFN
jgi:hypothetical protein